MAQSTSSNPLSNPPPPSPDPIFTIRPCAGEISCVQYADLDSGKHTVLMGTSSGVLGVWDLEMKREIWKQNCDIGIVAVEAVPDDIGTKNIISLGRQGKVTVWDIKMEAAKNHFETPDPSFCNFTLLTPSQDGTSTIALADKEHGKVNIFNISTGQQTASLSVKEPKTKGMVMCVRSIINTSTNTVQVLAGCEDGSLVVWDVRMPDKELSSLKMFSEPVMCLDYDNQRNHGVCGSPLKTLETFQLSQESILQAKYSVALRNSGVASVSIRHDGRIMCSGGWDGRIRVFGCKKGKPLAALNFHTATVQSVTFTSSKAPEFYSNLMICGSKDQRLSLWKLY